MCVLTIDEIKAAVTPVAAKYGLETVYLFGSYARGEATDNSDVDLLIDGYKEKALLYGVMIEDFKDNLKKNVDVISINTLNEKDGKKSSMLLKWNVNKDRRMIYDFKGLQHFASY